MKRVAIIIFLLFSMVAYSGVLGDFQKKQNDVNNRNRKHKNRKKISIISYPSGADIYINGKHHKEKTNTTVKLTVNKRYKIEIKKYGYTTSIKKFIFDGYKNQITFNLSTNNSYGGSGFGSHKRKVNIVSYPSGANIYINGVYRERTNSIIKLDLNRKYKIEVKKYGYITSVKDVVFNKYSSNKLVFNLQGKNNNTDDSLCNKWKVNPDIDACIRLQKKYYKKGKYTLSYKYGRIAESKLIYQCNEHNNNACAKLGIVCVLLKKVQ